MKPLQPAPSSLVTFTVIVAATVISVGMGLFLFVRKKERENKEKDDPKEGDQNTEDDNVKEKAHREDGTTDVHEEAQSESLDSEVIASVTEESDSVPQPGISLDNEVAASVTEESDSVPQPGTGLAVRTSEPLEEDDDAHVLQDSVTSVLSDEQEKPLSFVEEDVFVPTTAATNFASTSLPDNVMMAAVSMEEKENPLKSEDHDVPVEGSDDASVGLAQSESGLKESSSPGPCSDNHSSLLELEQLNLPENSVEKDASQIFQESQTSETQLLSESSNQSVASQSSSSSENKVETIESNTDYDKVDSCTDAVKEECVNSSQDISVLNVKPVVVEHKMDSDKSASVVISDSCEASSSSRNSQTESDTPKHSVSGIPMNSGHQEPSSVPDNGTDHGSTVCDSNSEASNDSGRGGSVGEALVTAPMEVTSYVFDVPQGICGKLIGRNGRHIIHIKDKTGATVTLSRNPYTPDFQVCCVKGLSSEVDSALRMIRKRFPIKDYPNLVMAPCDPSPVVFSANLEPPLPEGLTHLVVVTAVVNGGHIFFQMHQHPSLIALENMSWAMNEFYNTHEAPDMPDVIVGGSICACFSEDQWYRVLVVESHPTEQTCTIKYVDYGGYDTVPVSNMKLITPNFCTLPFQAQECFLANIVPLEGEEYFSNEAAELLMKLTRGEILKAEVVAKTEDDCNCVHLYHVSGRRQFLVNKEMADRGVVQWIDFL